MCREKQFRPTLGIFQFLPTPAQLAKSWRLLLPLGSNVDLDLLRLGFGFLLELQLEHTGIVLGIDILRVHAGGQGEGAMEAAVAALNAMEVLFLLLFVEVALAL